MGFNPKAELRRFLQEDIRTGDITSNLLDKKKINAKIISRQDCIAAGTKYAKEIFAIKDCKVKIKGNDGAKVKKNQTILEITGDIRNILTCERTALNLLSRMCGIATQTNYLVKKINKKSKKTKLFSTRKTAPGLRFFDKEAVKIGGGQKHRMALDEMVMIKDNHLLSGKPITELIQIAKKRHKKIEVEVETIQDAVIAAKNKADIIMLDNFTPAKIRQAISKLKKEKLRDKVKLEASGGITEKNIESYAATGIDMISVGSITYSVKGIDLSLEI